MTTKSVLRVAVCGRGRSKSPIVDIALGLEIRVVAYAATRAVVDIDIAIGQKASRPCRNITSQIKVAKISCITERQAEGAIEVVNCRHR